MNRAVCRFGNIFLRFEYELIVGEQVRSFRFVRLGNLNSSLAPSAELKRHFFKSNNNLHRYIVTLLRFMTDYFQHF